MKFLIRVSDMLINKENLYFLLYVCFFVLIGYCFKIFWYEWVKMLMLKEGNI